MLQKGLRFLGTGFRDEGLVIIIDGINVGDGGT